MDTSHRIKRQIIELEMTQDAMGYAQKNAIARRISAAFEEAFDLAYARIGDQQWHRLPKVELDLGELAPEALLSQDDTALRKRMQQAIEKQLLPLLPQRRHNENTHQEESQQLSDTNGAHQHAEDAKTTDAGRMVEAIRYFLLRGTLPWWARNQMEDVLAASVAISFSELQQVVKSKPAVLQRILHHYEDQQLLQWMEPSIGADTHGMLGYLLSKVSGLEAIHSIREATWYFTLVIHYDYSKSGLLLGGLVRHLLRQQPLEASQLYQSLMKDRSVPAKAWQEIWNSQQSILERKQVKGVKSGKAAETEKPQRGDKGAQRNQLSPNEQAVARDTHQPTDASSVPNEGFKGSSRESGDASFGPNEGFDRNSGEEPGNAQYRGGLAEKPESATNTNTDSPETSGDVKALLDQLSTLLLSTQLSVSLLGECVVLLERIMEVDHDREWETLVSDVLVIFKQRWSHFKRQQAGLTAQRLMALKTLLKEVTQQFALGNIAFQHQQEWQSLKEHIIEIYGLAEEEQESEIDGKLSSDDGKRPFPELKNLLSHWRQWRSALTVNTESRSMLSQLEDFMKTYRHVDEIQTWNALQMEGQWLVKETEKLAAKARKSTRRRVKVSDTPDGERWYLANAGTVILWSFLKPLFEALNWLEGDEFRDDKQERAIMMIHYLCCGQTTTTEDELILSKLMVGWPLEMPCAVEVALTEEELITADDLLQTVLSYNPLLNNSTVEALQGNFLMRDGVLSQWPDSWQLQVAEQPYDLILKRFPWSWQVVKTPWMESPLMVNWK